MKEAIEETESKDSANFVSVDYIEVYQTRHLNICVTKKFFFFNIKKTRFSGMKRTPKSHKNIKMSTKKSDLLSQLLILFVS